MTRYQVWKARERARFRLMGEFARCHANGVSRGKEFIVNFDARAADALESLCAAQVAASARGIPEPFLG